MENAPPPHIAPTTHAFLTADARRPDLFAPDSVDLVVTSPPYPMIAMWDDDFRTMNPSIGQALDTGNGPAAFRLMHAELARVWEGLLRAVRPGGFLCLNIGDAVRTVAGVFRLYPNHTALESFFLERGADILPHIIWRKTTNAPNKFMGSGMLPAGAYVTLEHEYILIVRKAGKRDFSPATEKLRRRRSALFWEERNAWYSDLWEVAGARQKLDRIEPGDLFEPERADSRSRSAAFPFEIACRLVAMYSLQGDVVVDPFLGTGTTTQAAAALGRHSRGIDIDPALVRLAERNLQSFVPAAAAYARARLERHIRFTAEHAAAGKTLLHGNKHHGFPVKTLQEEQLVVPVPRVVERLDDSSCRVAYEPAPTRRDPPEVM